MYRYKARDKNSCACLKKFVVRFKFTIFSALNAICQIKKNSPRPKIHGKSMVFLLKEADTDRRRRIPVYFNIQPISNKHVMFLNTYQLIIQIYSYFILKIKIKYITSVELHFQYINDEVEFPFITEGERSFSI